MVTLVFKFVNTNDKYTQPSPKRDEVDRFMTEDYFNDKRYRGLAELIMRPCKISDVTYNGNGRVSLMVNQEALDTLKINTPSDFHDFILYSPVDHGLRELGLGVYYPPESPGYDKESGIFDCRFRGCIFISKI